MAWGCRGYDFGQCSVPAGLSGVTAIAAGNWHSLALRNDGTVVAWGCGSDHDHGQCSVPAGLRDVTAIAAGSEFDLALTSDGTVVGWGSDSAGQSNVPAGLSGVTAIAAGEYHGLALKSDSTVVAWGCGDDQDMPTDIGQCSVPWGLKDVSAIAAGDWHSLALKRTGKVVAWGCASPHDYGQCNVPAGLSGITAIAAGRYDNSLAIVITRPAWDVNGDHVADMLDLSSIAGIGRNRVARLDTPRRQPGWCDRRRRSGDGRTALGPDLVGTPPGGPRGRTYMEGSSNESPRVRKGPGLAKV